MTRRLLPLLPMLLLSSCATLRAAAPALIDCAGHAAPEVYAAVTRAAAGPNWLTALDAVFAAVPGVACAARELIDAGEYRPQASEGGQRPEWIQRAARLDAWMQARGHKVPR